MGLAETQRLLARLTTDAELRDRFARDPGPVLDEFGLSVDDRVQLHQLPEGQLEEFARSLIRKRRGEVESLLPMTCRVVGPARLASLFTRHARGYVPKGIKKHRDDAVEFAGFVARAGLDPPWLAELARVEAGAVRAFDSDRRGLVLRLAHHPSDLARLAIEGGTLPRRRPTLIVWFRAKPGGRLRRWVLAWPRFARGI